MSLLAFLFLISLGYYGIVLLLLRDGINRLPNKLPSDQTLSVSVIVAVRNGEKSLPNLLADLSQQKYNGLLEFIIVNDQSIDNTQNLIQKAIIEDSRIMYLNSSEGSKNLTHKKRALDAGIKHATGEILLFTDVDCRLPKYWVQKMSDCFTDDVDFVIGNSKTPEPVNLVSSFQNIDYLMLMSAACGSVNRNWYWSSTGQNQAYRKSTFEACGGFDSLKKYLQGDDSLFLQICRKYITNFKAVFAIDQDAIVTCRQETNFVSFIKQRVRWSGDAKTMWKFNSIFFIMVLATFLTNLLLVLFFIIIFLESTCFPIFISAISIKFLLEFLIYTKGSSLFKHQISFSRFCIWYVIQIPYVVIMGLGSFFSNHLSWRE